MKRLIPYLVLVIAGLWIGASWIAPAPRSNDFDVRSFSRLPVLVGGRIKPLDTVARNSLLILRGKQTLRLADSSPLAKPMEASRWLADVLFNAPVADTYQVFAVANQEVLGMFGLPQMDKRYCTYAELVPHLQKIDEKGQLAAEIEGAKRTPFQTAIYNLRNSLLLYQQLKSSIQPENATDFMAEIQTYATFKQGAATLTKDQRAQLTAADNRYESQTQYAYMLAVAPKKGGNADDWLATGAALLHVESPQAIPVAVSSYAAMGDAWRKGDAAAFTRAADSYSAWIAREQPDVDKRSAFELRFNISQPFYHSMVLYVGAFLLACASWLVLPKGLRTTAFLLLVLALAVHSFGMFARMYIQGRPPVTNLYSSAIFVGWGAVLLGLVLERLFRDGIGAACAGMIGFITLIIAHHLGSNGDTLEMMQAVLDHNIWLATHVVIITAGYSAMFLAGFLAIVYVFLDLLSSKLSRAALAWKSATILVPVGLALAAASFIPVTSWWPADLQAVSVQVKLFLSLLAYAATFVVCVTFGLVLLLDLIGLRHLLIADQWDAVARNLTRMVYGIICFATLFSFVGTVLGGIWADQSWGRFWGWDPKENGALLIVLWCAIILHARWSGLIRQRGLMAMAIGGNAITSFSWFGVNMLGVGLHTYGFMEMAFPWLVAFAIAQGVFLLLSLQSGQRSHSSSSADSVTTG